MGWSFLQHPAMAKAAVAKSRSPPTVGTARTANLNTSWPFMARLEYEPCRRWAAM